MLEFKFCNFKFNFSILTNNFWLERIPKTDNVLTFPNLPDALKAINTPPLSEKVENVWIIGGASVYRVCNPFIFKITCKELIVLKILLIRKLPNTQAVIEFMWLEFTENLIVMCLWTLLMTANLFWPGLILSPYADKFVLIVD